MKKMIIMNPDENAKIVKGRISVVLRGRDLKFWERSEKNNILRRSNFSSQLAEVRKSKTGWILELSRWELRVTPM